MVPPHRSIHTPQLRPVWSQRYPPGGVNLVPELAVARREVIFSFTQVTWLELSLYTNTHSHFKLVTLVKGHGGINKRPHMLLTLQANRIPGINLDTLFLPIIALKHHPTCNKIYKFVSFPPKCSRMSQR